MCYIHSRESNINIINLFIVFHLQRISLLQLYCIHDKYQTEFEQYLEFVIIRNLFVISLNLFSVYNFLYSKNCRNIFSSKLINISVEQNLFILPWAIVHIESMGYMYVTCYMYPSRFPMYQRQRTCALRMRIRLS